MRSLLIITLLVMLVFPVASGAELISGIAAIVNDDIITSYEAGREYEQLLKEAEKKGPLDDAAKAQLRSTALTRLIDKKLIEQKIKELDIRISEEEVRQSIEEVKKQNNLTQENLVAALAGQGLSFDQYKAQLKEQLERLRLMSQEVRAKIQVGEREVREYYEANRAKFGEEERFRARHIFFKVDKNASSKEIKQVMDKACQVLKEIKTGKDFAELAKKYSEDASTAKDGGDLGTFRIGDMVPEIEATVVDMKPGEVSDLVKSPAGFHIIKLDERFKSAAKPLADVKAEIEDLLYKKKSEERFNQWVNDLRKGAAIEIKKP